ncbi:hypothetical protein RCZAHN_129 [Rhodobacter phage RcZahn]|nr:hypothetical protein RCZAHN_129 [Rhodobacter phage RcZahn]
MSENKDLVKVPTAQDKLRGEVEAIRRLLPVLSEAAVEIAQMRKRMYDEYIRVGFTPDQALQLCKTLTL